MEEKMLPWKVWDWDCNLILGLRAPSPSSAPPRPPVYSKTSARNFVKTHLLIGRRPKIQWSQNVLHFHRNPFPPTLVCTRRGVHIHTNNKNFCSPPIPLMLGKTIHASIQNIYMLHSYLPSCLILSYLPSAFWYLLSVFFGILPFMPHKKGNALVNHINDINSSFFCFMSQLSLCQNFNFSNHYNLVSHNFNFC